MNSEIIIVILGAAAATYLTRFPFMILSEKKIPSGLMNYLSFIAPAILTALIAPMIFIKQGKFDISLSNNYLIAAIITALVSYFSKNMLAALISGICGVAVLSVM